MRLSTERILTTHVGSLPRSQVLVDILMKKEKEEPYDKGEYERLIAEAVNAVVRRQAEVGIDIPSDGEQSKVSYSTYIIDRLSGFGGHTDRKPALDVAPYAEYRKKMGLIMGSQEFRRASCIGPIKVVDQSSLHRDIANMKAALKAANVAEGFMNAASPGLVTAFQPNAYYPSHEAYVSALADVMREEYEAIVAAGFVLQLDCPDLAMARHTGFQDLTEAEFLARAALHVEAMNHALANVPADRVRMHVCWGNYEGPHDHDIDLVKVLGTIMKAKPQAVLFEGANPRHDHEWVVWRDAKLPENKVLIPGVIDSCSNYVEHPELVAQRIERYAAIVGRERVIAGSDCGFGTFAGYGKVDAEIAYKKMGAMVDGAKIASRRLWRSAA